VLGDVSTVLTAGGSSAAKVGQVANLAKVANVGKAVSQAGKVLEPVTALAKLHRQQKFPV